MTANVVFFSRFSIFKPILKQKKQKNDSIRFFQNRNVKLTITEKVNPLILHASQ
jgi:hypothetical protein